MSKKCTPLWREAHFEVKTYKAHQVRTTFGSCDVEKAHAVHISKSKCTKHRSSGSLLEVEMSKKRTPLWREAHFQVKIYKTPHVRATFGGSDVEKVHAVVARSTFPSQNVQNTTCSRHFWRFRCRFASLHYTTLRYTTLHNTTVTTTQLHSTTLNYTPLHSTTLNYTPLHYTTFHYTSLHYIALRYTPLHYNYNYITTLHLHSATLNYTTLHDITLHYTTFHYTPLHYTTLHYTTLHYTTLHSTTLHYIPLHFTPLHYHTLHYTSSTTLLPLHFTT